MRPTIPLAVWRLAIDLDATRALRQARGPHTLACPDRLCRNWARVFERVLPEPLREDLRRVGIDPLEAADLTAGWRADPGSVDYHVTYHCVGRILSGPPSTLVDERLGEMQGYHALRPDPWLSMRVAYPREHDPTPEWITGEMRPLITVDLRLMVPWVLEEPLFPPVRETPKPWRGMRSPIGPRTLRRRIRRFEQAMRDDEDLR